MYKFIIAVISVFAFIGIVGAMNFTTNYTMGNGNASMVTPTIANSSNYSHSASAEAVYSAQNYIVSILGQSYYNGYISYYASQSLGNASYVYFKYNIPYANGTTTTGLLGGSQGPLRYLGITVSLNGTSVTGYIGPAMPYTINISVADAIGVAHEDGIDGNTAAIYGMFQNSSLNSYSKYSIAWAVTNTSSQKGNIHKGVYVDVGNGTIIGQFIYNPAIRSPTVGANYGVTGNFSLFNTKNQTGGSNNSTDSQLIIPLIILAFIMLGIGLYMSRRER